MKEDFKQIKFDNIDDICNFKSQTSFLKQINNFYDKYIENCNNKKNTKELNDKYFFDSKKFRVNLRLFNSIKEIFGKNNIFENNFEDDEDEDFFQKFIYYCLSSLQSFFKKS